MNNDLIARRIELPASAASPRSTADVPPSPAPDTPLDQPELDPGDEFVSFSPPWDAPPDDDLWDSAELAEDTSPASDDQRLRLVFPAFDQAGYQQAREVDQDDSLAAIAADLLLSAALIDEDAWAEPDLAAAQVVELEAVRADELLAEVVDSGSAEVLESWPGQDDLAGARQWQPSELNVEQAAQTAEAESASAWVAEPEPARTDAEPAAPAYFVPASTTGPLGWSPAVRYSSVFGDLFRQPVPVRAGPDEPDVAAHEAPAAVAPPDPFDWPPVPADFFPPMHEARPQLNLEPQGEPEVAIRWPDDPRAQIFWPPEQAGGGLSAAEQASPGDGLRAPTSGDPLPDDELPAEQGPPAIAHDPVYMPRDARFEPRFMLEDVPAKRPLLIFSDPPSEPPLAPEMEPQPVASGDSRFARLANQASAFAERIPDHWALTTAPSLTVAGEDGVARELSEIQSPALTVLFAIVVIGAVLLFVYLVTPLLR